MASEGELARRGLRHLLALWLKMSGFILGMLQSRVGRQILSALIPSSRVSLGRGAGVGGGWWGGVGAVAVVYVCALAVRGRDGRKQLSQELTGYLWDQKLVKETPALANT